MTVIMEKSNMAAKMVHKNRSLRQHLCAASLNSTVMFLLKQYNQISNVA